MGKAAEASARVESRVLNRVIYLVIFAGKDMKYPNPYTPGPGFMPAYLAGREQILHDSEKYLDAIENRYPQQSVIYWGLRGVGKTVLLNAIESGIF